MKKKLIFAFSVFENCLDNRAIQIHLNSLKYYCDVFDEALFVFMGERKHSVPVINELLKIGFKEIEFKFRDIDHLWEAGVYYHEIAETRENDDKLCFFAHTKGVSNYTNHYCKSECIDAWITTLYYFNLCDADSVREWMVKEFNPVMYGTHLHFYNENTQVFFRNEYQYSGTFYWVNLGHLRKVKPVLPKMVDRWWGEKLPNEVGRHYLMSFSAYGTVIDNQASSLYNDLSFCQEIFDYTRHCNGDDRHYERYQDYLKEIGVNINIPR